MSQSAIRQNAGVKIVLYTGPGNAHQLKIIFLLGCHMIMTHGWSSDDALSAFKPLTDLILTICPDGSVQSSWRALYWARTRNWIDFKETFDLGLDNYDCIQMDEYLHYARFATFATVLCNVCIVRRFQADNWKSRSGTASTSHRTPRTTGDPASAIRPRRRQTAWRNERRAGNVR